MFYGRFAVEGDNPVDNPNRKNEKSISDLVPTKRFWNGRENNSKVYGRQINQRD
jgi:hypothetical protein